MADRDIKTAIKVLKEMVLSGNLTRPLTERQRAIDALTLFHKDSRDAFADIIRRTDNPVLKERAELYLKRIEDGAELSMNI